MRTVGSFQKIYNQCKDYYFNTNNCITDMPINPMIRQENEMWMIESDLEPTCSVINCPLDTFHNYFYETYHFNYVLDSNDENDFIEFLK